jgi:hypothetical protein
MGKMDKRLDELEATIKPDKRPPFIAIFEQEGVYWLADTPDHKVDYRVCVSGQRPDCANPGVHYITEDEFHRLEKIQHVLLVRYVKMAYPGEPTEAGQLDWRGNIVQEVENDH